MKKKFKKHIEKGVQNKLISFNSSKTQITYHVKRNYSTSFTNPEEQVRAAFFCELVLDYHYPAERIQFEVLTKPHKDRIDLLLYRDDELQDPFLVVECKRDGIIDTEFQEAVEQAFRYANYKRAWYVVVVEGNYREQYNVKGYKSGERVKNKMSDLPTNYGEPPAYKYFKTEGKDLEIVSREELIRAFKKCHNIVWQGGKLTPTVAFDEISKLLFCKLQDEKETEKNEPYKFQKATEESSEEIFKRLDAIYQKEKKNKGEEIFKEDIHLSPEVVLSCVEVLQALAINKIDLDAKGIAFEKFMQDFFKGKMGQFFTPRNVVRFAVDMMQPNNKMLVLDPACGSGGFLLNALDYVRNYAKDNYTEVFDIYDHWNDFAKERLFGIEINDQIARVCKMNMILHNDGHTNIISTDSLDHIDQFVNKGFQKNRFDLILTNPPFGAKIKSSEKEYLKFYRLGNNKNQVRKNQKIEILFIERCVEFLTPGTGKMAIVLPDGILNNSSLQYVRNYIMETCQILAIISLPQTAFLHYGAGVKSSLLFVRKKGALADEEIGNYPIFMAIAKHIGYDATGRETPNQNDFPEILAQYQTFEQTPLNFLESFDWQNQIYIVNQNEIEDGRLDSHFYKPEYSQNRYKVQKYSYKQLGELVQFSKETWNRTKQDSFTQKFPYIEISNIDIKTGDIKNISEIDILDAPSRAKMIVRENDILLSQTAPSRGAISLIDQRFDGFIASTGFAIIRKIKIESLDRKYLFYALRLPLTLKQFEQRSTGGVYPNITKAELQKALIPVPPKEIQIRIVTLMDRAYTLKKEKEKEATQVLEKAKKEVEDILLRT